MKIQWRKVWYGLAIGLSGILLLLNVAVFLGVWIAEGPLIRVTYGLLESVVQTSEGIRELTGRIDLQLEQLLNLSNDLSIGINQINQNVTDKGLIMVLLPNEKVERLKETSDSLVVTFTTIRDSLTMGLELYRAIDQLPFITIPMPGKTQIEEADQSLTKIQVSVDDFRQKTKEFREAVRGGVDKLQENIDRLTQEIGASRDALAKLDTSLIELQESADHLRNNLRQTIRLSSIVLSLILLFGTYTQVEFIRIYVERWRNLKTSLFEQ